MDVLTLANQYLSERTHRKTFIPGQEIPASGQYFNPQDITELVDVVLGGWYTEHKVSKKFSDQLCLVMEHENCVLTNSGSSASLLAMTAAIHHFQHPGKYVVTTALGFPTTVYPIYQNGKIPIFIDVDPDTLAPIFSQLSQAFEKYGKEICGVILTHTLGFPFLESAIREYLGEDQFFISDACDSLGAEIREDGEFHSIGYWSDLVTLSFFPAHQISAVEGGAVLCSNQELSDRVSRLKNWSRKCICLPGQTNTCGRRFQPEYDKLPEGWDCKYTFEEIGYNLKTTDLNSSLGLSQIHRLNEFLLKRRANFTYLYSELSKVPGIKLIKFSDWSIPSPFGFPIRVVENGKFSTAEVIAHLEAANIRTRRVFGGNLIRQPAFKNLQYVNFSLTGTDRVMDTMFWVGVQPSLGELQMRYIATKIKELMNNG